MTVKNDGPKKVDNCDAYNITVSSGKVEHKAIMFALNSWTDDLKIASDFADFHRAVSGLHSTIKKYEVYPENRIGSKRNVQNAAVDIEEKYNIQKIVPRKCNIN